MSKLSLFQAVTSALLTQWVSSKPLPSSIGEADSLISREGDDYDTVNLHQTPQEKIHSRSIIMKTLKRKYKRSSRKRGCHSRLPPRRPLDSSEEPWPRNRRKEFRVCSGTTLWETIQNVTFGALLMLLTSVKKSQFVKYDGLQVRSYYDW